MADASETCPVTHCDAPDVSCNMGNDYRTCPLRLSRALDEDLVATQTIAGDEGAASVPWSSGSLGLRDVSFVAAQGKPIVIGVVGPHNSGKTSLLTAIYLMMSQGAETRGLAFAGSYTLGAWESLAHHLRWTGGRAPTFPPHTSRAQARVPGLLHLTLGETPPAQKLDILLTDAPGEWFARWAINEDAHDAEGARWVGRNADVLLVVVDSEALAGEERGLARNEIREIARRISSVRGNRPIALVWSKADVTAPETIRDQVRASFRTQFGDDWSEFPVALPISSRGGKLTKKRMSLGRNIPRDLSTLLEWALSAATNSARYLDLPESSAIMSEDPFLAFRGRDA